MGRAARRSDRPALAAPHRPPADPNAAIAWLLRDMAAAQSSRQKQFGYKRAASAVFWLDYPLSPGALTRKVPGLGPAYVHAAAVVGCRHPFVAVCDYS